jgi:hypothetical protein
MIRSRCGGAGGFCDGADAEVATLAFCLLSWSRTGATVESPCCWLPSTTLTLGSIVSFWVSRAAELRGLEAFSGAVASGLAAADAAVVQTRLARRQTSKSKKRNVSFRTVHPPLKRATWASMAPAWSQPTNTRQADTPALRNNNATRSNSINENICRQINLLRDIVLPGAGQWAIAYSVNGIFFPFCGKIWYLTDITTLTHGLATIGTVGGERPPTAASGRRSDLVVFPSLLTAGPRRFPAGVTGPYSRSSHLGVGRIA